MLILYLGFWFACIVTQYFLARRMQLSLGVVSFSHAVPTLIAAVMAWIFLIQGASTTAQIAAGSQQASDNWSLWSDLWPFLLGMAALSTVGHFFWFLVVCVSRLRRKWIGIAAAALLMSIAAFGVVVVNFPDA